MVGGGGYSGHEHKSSGTAGLSERRDVCLFIEKLVNEEEEIVALVLEDRKKRKSFEQQS